jgi:hypothetical protein
MTNTLLEKLRKSRQTTIPAGGFNFIIQRPTQFDLGEMAESGLSAKAVLKRFVVGWDVKEIDIIPGGSATTVPFDADVFAEWVAEQPDIWPVLRDSIWAEYTAHNKVVDDELGEAKPGSNPQDSKPASPALLSGGNQTA